MVVICRGSILKCHSSPATLCADIVHTKCNAAPLLAAVSAAGSSPASASPGCSTYYSATARKKVKRSSETSLSNAKTKISLSEKIGSIVKLLDKLASSIVTDSQNFYLCSNNSSCNCSTQSCSKRWKFRSRGSKHR